MPRSEHISIKDVWIDALNEINCDLTTVPVRMMQTDQRIYIDMCTCMQTTIVDFNSTKNYLIS